MTQFLSQRIDAAFSNLAMIGLLSPLIVAALTIVTVH
jgi:hypothetical protein